MRGFKVSSVFNGFTPPASRSLSMPIILVGSVKRIQVFHRFRMRNHGSPMDVLHEWPAFSQWSFEFLCNV
jgi:hypothetical protein